MWLFIAECNAQELLSRKAKRTDYADHGARIGRPFDRSALLQRESRSRTRRNRCLTQLMGSRFRTICDRPSSRVLGTSFFGHLLVIAQGET